MGAIWPGGRARCPGTRENLFDLRRAAAVDLQILTRQAEVPR